MHVENIDTARTDGRTHGRKFDQFYKLSLERWPKVAGNS